jgi:rod shape determining protein RodA
MFAGMLALGLLQNVHLRSSAALPTRLLSSSRVLASR